MQILPHKHFELRISDASETHPGGGACLVEIARSPDHG
jgi:hypothetical protein